MKKILLQLVVLGLMNTIANASSSYYLDTDCGIQESRRMQPPRGTSCQCDQSPKDLGTFPVVSQQQKQQILQALEILARSLKPSTTIKPSDSVVNGPLVGGAGRVAIDDDKDPTVDSLAIGEDDVVDLTPAELSEAILPIEGKKVVDSAEELVPAAGRAESPTSLNIPSTHYAEHKKAYSQQFADLTNAVHDALYPAHSLAVANIDNECLQPDESLKLLKTQASALKKQLKELNVRSHCNEWSDDSEDESPIHRTTRNGNQHKECEAQKEQIKKQLQVLTEKIRGLKAAKKKAHDLEQLKRKILDDQKAAKDDNDRIEKSTARLKPVFDQATLERHNQFQEQSNALADALKEYLSKIDKEFVGKCSVAKQKLEIDLYTKKCTALKELARRQNKRALELLRHERDAELASFTLDFEKNLRDLQNAADVVRLIISGGNEETTPIPALFCEAVKSSSKL